MRLIKSFVLPLKICMVVLAFTLCSYSKALIQKQNISASPFFYSSPVSYQTDILDGYIVQDSANNRIIPVLVRYPLNTTGQLPIIIWSHGGLANVNGRLFGAQWGTAFAEAGYIVIHMSHVPRNTAQLIALYNEFGVPPSEGGQFFNHLEVDRPRDTAAVLNDLKGIENTFPLISGKIDYERIAVAGHSFGSYTVMTIAGGRVELTPKFNDVSFAHPLPKVFFASSPQGPGAFGWKDNSWREIARPVMMTTGKGDNTDNESAEDRRIPFEKILAGNKYRFYINDINATHEVIGLSDQTNPEFPLWLKSVVIAYFDHELRQIPYAGHYLISNRILRGSRKTGILQNK